MATFARLITAIVGVAVLAGCTSQVEGTPVAGDAVSSGDYRSDLSSAEQNKLQERAEKRRLDPCGFINEAAIATIGDPAYFGPGQSFDKCEVNFLPNPTGIRSAEVDLGHGSTAGDPATIAGTKVHLDKGMGCVITVPYQTKHFSYWFTAAETDGFGSEPDVCATAKKFVAAALPTLDTTPVRGESPKSIDSRLSRMDPCAPLNKLSYDPETLDVRTNLIPYVCDFWFTEDDASTRYGWTSTQGTLGQLNWAKSKGEVETIDGVAVRREVGTTDCSVWLYFTEDTPRELDRDGNGPPASHHDPLDETYVDSIQFSGGKAGSCPRKQEILQAIIDTYHEK